MNRGRSIYFVATVVAAVVLCAPITFAQPQDMGPSPPSTGRAADGLPFPPSPMAFLRGFPPFGPPSSPAEMCVDATAHRAGLLAYVKAKLGLTQPQLAVWRDLEATFDEIETDERERCAHLPAKFEQLSVPQVLKIAEERLATSERNLEKAAPVVRRLYDALSPEQRKILDRLISPPMPF